MPSSQQHQQTNAAGVIAPHAAAYGVEKIPATVYPSSDQASKAVAAEIAELIRTRSAKGEKAVLGLATGSTPTAVYDELIRLHQQEDLSFQNVITFNLDEYYPMRPDELQSYNRFMREHLFDHLDIDPKNTHVPDGTAPRDQVWQYCQRYEKMIKDAGGLDFQILGIGRTGHVGFNEPGSPRDSRTRLITLDRITRMDAASDFFGEWNVPRKAITMGVDSIMSAKKVVLMAWGENKATVTGWPGGKPRSETSQQEAPPGAPTFQHANADVFPKRVVVFSPHPDDDVISMGGTFIRLCQQEHEVHVAYQTSGNIAVFDEAALRHADFVREYAQAFGLGERQAQRIEDQIESFVSAKQPGQVDTPELQRIKGLIR